MTPRECCPDQTASVMVYIGTTLCGALPMETATSPLEYRAYPITCNAVGDYVRLVIGESGGKFLGFSEVEVYTKFDKSIKRLNWTRVRHVPKGTTWHPAKDKLDGTEEYGDPSNDLEAWSINWDKSKV